MKTPDMNGPEMAELDRQTGEVLGPWFASETIGPPPPEILAGVESRVQTTGRRAGWRIPDRWLWQRSETQRASFVLATATGVLVLALTGVTSAGVFLLANTGGSDPMGQQAGAPASDDSGDSEVGASPATALVQAMTEAPVATAETQVEPTSAAEPVVLPPMGETVATKVSGSVTVAPSEVDPGTSDATATGDTAVSGLRTVATVAFDDDRLSGLQSVVRNELRFGANGGGVVAAGSISIENEGGSWRGTFESATPPGRPGALRAVQLTGEGDYDGFTALLHYDLAKEVGDTEMITGVVIPGSLPELPKRDKFAKYEVYADEPGATEQREPRDRDREGLPTPVAGSMDMTIEWLTDDAVVREAGPDELGLMPEWSVSDLTLDDPRMQLSGYEVMLNTRYPGELFIDNSAVSAGRSRGWSADGGSWQGLIRAFSDPTLPAAEWQQGRHMFTLLTGGGAYEGQTALLFNTPLPDDPDAAAAVKNDLAAEWDEYLDSWSVEGMLFVGALPQHPEAP